MSEVPLSANGLELWAGVECTVNRVGDRYLDQLERSGHAIRRRDLERLGDIGVRSVRYPLLWERTAPSALENPNWAWSDDRIQALKRLGLNPIVGLIHHGSGPRYTNLLDPAFPDKLACYAEQVARRYPWIIDYTPINEPLTTARFSCLYGHWYPHARDPLLFAQALLTQCRGIVLAMRAIRAINPAARLIQTEDLGKTFSTAKLAYQASFENDRRWLTFDVLSGRLRADTPMGEYFCWLGIERRELEWFVDNPLPPNVLGINYYITSERFLDERINRYPEAFHGGNGQHRYADVEAVRVRAEGVAGAKAILKEAWERYHRPLAITEVHLGCTREEQLRWLHEAWNAAVALRQSAVDVRAITAWAAFGTFDWNSLLTCDDGCYEPGLFDLRSPTPRPTALFHMARSLATEKRFDHAVLDTAGWWRRLNRLCYPPVSFRPHGISMSREILNKPGERCRSLVITGATGTLGNAFARICEKRGLPYHLLSRKQLDIADRDSVIAAIESYEPWAIINAAGYVRVDDAEKNVDACLRENATGPELLAKECAVRRLPFLTFSSDLVFDGLKSAPYVESDAVSPLNVYGKSKVEAETRVLSNHPEALVIRTSAFFGPWDTHNFVYSALQALSKGRLVTAARDTFISPTYVPDLVNAALDLLIDGEQGLWHLANTGVVTWVELARMAAARAGYDRSLVHARPTLSLGYAATRPTFSALASERANLMPSFETSLEKCLLEMSCNSRESTAVVQAQS